MSNLSRRSPASPPPWLRSSSAELRETPSPTSSIKLDSVERLTMKTRVAIREKNHRFQVVPLRDAGHYPSGHHTPSKSLKTTVVTATRSSGLARLNLHSRKKLCADENTVPTFAESYTKIISTPERLRRLQERNEDLRAAEYSSFKSRAKTTTNSRHVNSESSAQNTLISQALTETSKHNAPPRRPSLENNNYSGRHSLHFKSPSLGSLRTKPDSDLDLEATPVPRVTCRKRTNTLSAAHDICHGDMLPANVENDRRNLMRKVDSVKRHAIYTQSLCIPMHERPKTPSEDVPKLALEESSLLRAFPFRSSIPVSRNKDDSTTRRSEYTTSALAVTNMPAGPEESSHSTAGSQSSVSSVYSQDESSPSQAPLVQTRPLMRLASPSGVGQTGRDSKVDEISIQHHPIISMLLLEVEKAREVWCTI
ncbi:hypothetical protein LshimejAT787_0102140 [Lyophyllum shimeji]|uniref:Uncharacterized protein n=1 Tax=Lyophyllum shimeji TaxID=47721 RepID=A0A9P3PCE6_LYOSH|nr:hypothetical protein LshimejAT787_0102140 [Lyophyllum shimeji]